MENTSSFDIKLDKENINEFKSIMGAYPNNFYVTYMETERHLYIKFIGEGMEADCEIQETLLEQLPSVTIEENIK